MKMVTINNNSKGGYAPMNNQKVPELSRRIKQAGYRMTVGRSRIIPQFNITNLTNAVYYVNSNNFDSNRARASCRVSRARSTPSTAC